MNLIFSPVNVRELDVKVEYNSQLNQHLISTVLNSLKEEMLKLGNMNLTKEDVQDIFEKGYYRDWVIDWQKKNSITPQKLIFKDFIEYLKPEELNVEYIDFMLEIVELRKVELLGTRNKAPDPYKGKDYAEYNLQLASSSTIQMLATFLRIDTYIENESITLFEKVRLSDDHCRFIYDFMTFFKIYFFRPVEVIDNITTTKPKAIRSLINSFNKRRDINELQKSFYIIYDNINKTIKK